MSDVKMRLSNINCKTACKTKIASADGERDVSVILSAENYSCEGFGTDKDRLETNC